MHQLSSNPNTALQLVRQRHAELTTRARAERVRRQTPRQFHRSRR